jgi:hypothetical protein
MVIRIIFNIVTIVDVTMMTVVRITTTFIASPVVDSVSIVELRSY